jgi:hypothetical protein
VLSIVKNEIPSFTTFFTNLPSLLYFIHLACQIKDEWLALDTKAKHLNIKLIKDYNNFCSLNEDVSDKLLYIQDILTLDIVQINKIMLNSLMYYAIMPLLICNICMPSKKTYYVNVNSSLFFLNQIFDANQYESFQNIIVIIMLLQKVPQYILTYSEELPRAPATYTQKWVYKKNSQVFKLQDSILN